MAFDDHHDTDDHEGAAGGDDLRGVIAAAIDADAGIQAEAEGDEAYDAAAAEYAAAEAAERAGREEAATAFAGERIDRPPHGLKPAVKARWDQLDPEVRAEFARREREIQEGFTRQERAAETINKIDALFSSRRDQLAMAGVTPVEAVQQLLAAQSFLERDPVNALVHLARSYGVDLRQFASGVQPAQAQGQPGAMPPDASQLPPQLQALMDKVTTLEQEQAQQRSHAIQARNDQINDLIDDFAGDPDHRFFADVADHMGDLISAGHASSLAQAYDMACWARPDIRHLILMDQRAQEMAAQKDAARAKASSARAASGSVTGFPGPGMGPAAADNSQHSLRDDIAAAIAASQA